MYMLYAGLADSIIRILGCPIDMQDDKHQKAYREAETGGLPK